MLVFVGEADVRQVQKNKGKPNTCSKCSAEVLGNETTD